MKLCLIVLSNIWEVSIIIYLILLRQCSPPLATVYATAAASPRLVVGFSEAGVVSPRPFWFLPGHCSFSQVIAASPRPAVYRRRPGRVSPMCDITTRGGGRCRGNRKGNGEKNDKGAEEKMSFIFIATPGIPVQKAPAEA